MMTREFLTMVMDIVVLTTFLLAIAVLVCQLKYLLRPTKDQIRYARELAEKERDTWVVYTYASDRVAELEQVCGELYQVIGALADHAGCYDHPDVQRALDNAAHARLVHSDLLPWPHQSL